MYNVKIVWNGDLAVARYGEDASIFVDCRKVIVWVSPLRHEVTPLDFHIAWAIARKYARGERPDSFVFSWSGEEGEWALNARREATKCAVILVYALLSRGISVDDIFHVFRGYFSEVFCNDKLLIECLESGEVFSVLQFGCMVCLGYGSEEEFGVSDAERLDSQICSDVDVIESFSFESMSRLDAMECWFKSKPC